MQGSSGPLMMAVAGVIAFFLLMFYAASESEAAVAAKQLNLVQDERDRYHAALVALSDMMGPKGREAFVMLGPRMFSAALGVVQEALK